MDTDQTYTPQQAVSYYLKNSEFIKPSELLRNMAVHDPDAFVAFLEEVTGVSAAKVAGLLAKNHPDTFMRRATFENRHFEAAKFIIAELTVPNSGGKIPAIRKAREVWGLGLKEAKDIIDTVQYELQQMRITGRSNGENKIQHFDDTMQNIYLKIMEAAL